MVNHAACQSRERAWNNGQIAAVTAGADHKTASVAPKMGGLKGVNMEVEEVKI